MIARFYVAMACAVSAGILLSIVSRRASPEITLAAGGAVFFAAVCGHLLAWDRPR